MCEPFAGRGEKKQAAGGAAAAAATEGHGFSPTLVRASADYDSPPFLAWAFVTLCTASFYLGPLILASPLFVYLYDPSAAATALATAVFLACHPVRPARRFCKWCQMFYRVFDFHHNFTPRVNEVARRSNRLSIVAMHPHCELRSWRVVALLSRSHVRAHPFSCSVQLLAIIPLHGFIWSAICDQLLPDMYGFGCTTDQALNLPVLRHLLQVRAVLFASLCLS